MQGALLHQPSGLRGLAEASTLLDLSLQAMEDTQEKGLQPADMVSLVQLLSLTADLPTEQLGDATNHSQGDIQELGHHFLNVADSIISEENAFKWQAIKEVRVCACVCVRLSACVSSFVDTFEQFANAACRKAENSSSLAARRSSVKGSPPFNVGIASCVFTYALKLKGKSPTDFPVTSRRM